MILLHKRKLKKQNYILTYIYVLVFNWTFGTLYGISFLFFVCIFEIQASVWDEKESEG
jgi:hypothetical protein